MQDFKSEVHDEISHPVLFQGEQIISVCWCIYSFVLSIELELSCMKGRARFRGSRCSGGLQRKTMCKRYMSPGQFSFIQICVSL